MWTFGKKVLMIILFLQGKGITNRDDGKHNHFLCFALIAYPFAFMSIHLAVLSFE